MVGNRATAALLRLPVQRKWDLDKYLEETKNRKNLVDKMVTPDAPKEARKTAVRRLREWAEVTDSPKQVETLLDQVGRAELTDLLKQGSGADITGLLSKGASAEVMRKTLQKAKGVAGLGIYFKDVLTKPGEPNQAEAVELATLEPDLEVLQRLRPLITGVPHLKGALAVTPAVPEGRGAYLETTIGLAGDWATVAKLSVYKQDVGVIRKLLEAAPKDQLVAAANDSDKAKVIKDAGPKLLSLLPYGNLNLAITVLGQNLSNDKSIREMTRGQLQTGAAGTVMHPSEVRFTQDTVTNQGEGYTVKGNIQKLKQDPNWNIPGPVRLFIMTEEIGRKARPNRSQFGVAHPANLHIGKVYTLDNRRLYAYQQAGREAMPGGQFVPLGTVLNEAYKFTTTSGGEVADLTS
jgi:hypothetical protein